MDIKIYIKEINVKRHKKTIYKPRTGALNRVFFTELSEGAAQSTA